MEVVVGDKKERERDVRVRGFFYTSWAGRWLTRSYISLFVTPELGLEDDSHPPDDSDVIFDPPWSVSPLTGILWLIQEGRLMLK